jgi:hypothetical protein
MEGLNPKAVFWGTWDTKSFIGRGKRYRKTRVKEC